MKVAIIYGWSEGPWQSRKLRRAAQADGHQIVKDPRQAEVIIAHSSGCYLIPKEAKAGKILLIGPPLWPGRPLMQSVARKLKEDLYTSYRGNYFGWSSKIVHNWFYILARPKSSYQTRRLKEANLPIAGKGLRIILVRNSLDTFCEPEAATKLAKARGYHLIKLPGGHDDCWIRPERYLRLIK